MIQTIFVFFVIYISFLFFSRLGRKNWKYAIGGIFVYAVFMGLRYGLGVDFFNYKMLYFDAMTGGSISRIEFLFRELMLFLSTNGFDYSVFLFIVAFLQLFFLYFFLRKEPDLWIPFFTIFVLSSVWLTYNNGLRQNLAFCIFVYSFPYVFCKSPIKYFLMILLASLIHKSALLLLPIYFVFNKKNEWFSSTFQKLGVLFVALVLGQLNIVQDVLQKIDVIAEFFGYESYLDTNNTYVVDTELKVGLGYFIWLILDVICLCYSNQVKNYLVKNQSYYAKIFPSIMDLYVIGLFIKHAFLISKAIGRINYYFYGFQVIVFSFLLYWAFKNNKKNAYLILVLFLLIFIATIIQGETNTAIYIFNWQDDLFYLQPYSFLDINF